MEGGSQKLTEADLCEYLRRIDISCNESDLKTPSQNFVMRVYQKLLLSFRIDITSSSLVPFTAVQQLENLEYYESTKPFLIVVFGLNQILRSCGLDISIKDVMEPKPKRTKKILNYLIVFLNYYLEKTSHFVQLEKQFQEEENRVKSLSVEVDTLKDILHEKQQKLKNLKKNEEELLNHIAKDEALSEKYVVKHDEISTRNQDLKAQETALSKKMATIDVDIANHKVKLEEFGQLIINSPERMNNEIVVLKERVKEYTNKVKEINLKVKEKTKDLERLKESHKEACDLKIISDLKSKFDTLRIDVADIVSKHQKIMDEDKKIEGIELELQSINDGKNISEKEAAKANIHLMKEKEVLLETIRVYESEIQKEEAACSSVLTQLEEVKMQIKTLEEKFAKNAKKYDLMHSEMDKKEKEFISSMEKMNSDFNTDYDAATEELKRATKKGI